MLLPSAFPILSLFSLLQITRVPSFAPQVLVFPNLPTFCRLHQGLVRLCPKVYALACLPLRSRLGLIVPSTHHHRSTSGHSPHCHEWPSLSSFQTLACLTLLESFDSIESAFIRVVCKSRKETGTRPRASALLISLLLMRDLGFETRETVSPFYWIFFLKEKKKTHRHAFYYNTNQTKRTERNYAHSSAEFGFAKACSYNSATRPSFRSKLTNTDTPVTSQKDGD